MKKMLLLFFVFSGVHSSFPFEISLIPHLGKNFTVIRIPASSNNLSLFLKNKDSGLPYKSFNSLESGLKQRGQSLAFGINGGMFHADFSPVGLLIENHKITSSLNLKDGKGNFFLKPNGVFAWNEKKAWVLESQAFLKQDIHPTWATQSGPMLVIEGKIHPAFNPESSSRLIRNAVGLSTKNEIVFCISEEPVNFNETATLFKEKLSCRNALYLDGTVSSLYSKELNRNDGNYDLGPLIVITKQKNREL